MNNFGGDWTKIKIEILVEYAKAYLTIMKNRKFFNLLYFDGFAGSGLIIKNKKQNIEITVGAARRIIEISKPRAFDYNYFVENDQKNFNLLKKMQVGWRSIESLKGLPIDMWILVPTGLGVNRLLKNNGQISDAWLKKLEIFLGLTRIEIEGKFYRKSATLFEEITNTEKERNAIKNSALLYQSRLMEVFAFVSKPYELKNSSNSTMYHLFLTSNNKTAEKIGNEIVAKYNN